MTKTINIVKLISQLSVLALIVLSLFPGSLLGGLFFQDFSRQIILIKTPFGYSINHFVSFFSISIFVLFLFLKDPNFKKLEYGLFFLSIILEILQYIVPNRSFEYYDLIANFLGVLIAFFLVKIYSYFKKS
jgi:glycopeptide antibiotics resistance protein